MTHFLGDPPRRCEACGNELRIKPLLEDWARHFPPLGGDWYCPCCEASKRVAEDYERSPRETKL